VAENGGLSDFIWFDVTESEIPLGSEGYAKLRIKWSVNHYDNNWSNPTEFWSDEHTSSSQKTWNFNNPDVLEVTSHNEDGDIIASGGVGGTQYGGHISGTITEQEST
jgi:hypothetical protein